MITITYENFMAALALFTAMCIAGGWLIKIIKGLKKPSDDVHTMLDNDNNRLKALEGNYKYLVESNNLVIRTLFVILGELAVNNDGDGKIKQAQDKINDFLISN